LFVCTANQHRSRTAEDLYRLDPRYEVRSAGTDVYEQDPSEQPVTGELIAWAELIFVMEQYHKDALEERFPGSSKKVVVLEVPDFYYRGDPELVRLLEMRISSHMRHA